MVSDSLIGIIWSSAPWIIKVGILMLSRVEVESGLDFIPNKAETIPLGEVCAMIPATWVTSSGLLGYVWGAKAPTDQVTAANDVAAFVQTF